MRVTTSDLPSRLMLALLTALLLIAPGGQAYARSRAFQMGIWTDRNSAPGVDTDIAVIFDTVEQPAGRSIVIRSDYNKPFTANEYEWSRVVAVVIDEPFNDFNSVRCWSAATVAAVNARMQLLAERAAELKAVAPKTRFWVNLAKPQLDWVTTKQCVEEQGIKPVYVNQPYIDVISVDIYQVRFNRGVKRYYDWLSAHRAKPDQQLALIPGTHYRRGKDNPADSAAIVRGYFDYANKANRKCNLPLGSRGQTGNFDGCRVWIVMGWLGPNHTEPDGTTYVGVRDPTAGPIADLWKSTLALPLRPDLAR